MQSGSCFWTQVYLVHSVGKERRVAAELQLSTDSSDAVTLTQDEAKVTKKVKVKVSIPVDYAMDVYVPAASQNSSVAVGGMCVYTCVSRIYDVSGAC